MSRKIRNLAGEPVGAREVDQEIRRLQRENYYREQEREWQERGRKWFRELELEQAREVDQEIRRRLREQEKEWEREREQKREREWREKMEGKHPRISYSEDELVSRYFAHRLVIDPSSSVVSAELTQDFFKWASERGFRVNRSLVVRMVSESFLVSVTYAGAIRQSYAPVTDNLLARLDTNNPPTSKSVTVWHGLRWADDDAEELI